MFSNYEHYDAHNWKTLGNGRLYNGLHMSNMNLHNLLKPYNPWWEDPGGQWTEELPGYSRFLVGEPTPQAGSDQIKLLNLFFPGWEFTYDEEIGGR